ncbi:MAG: ABC transporter permease [Planctomycetota bacterium]
MIGYLARRILLFIPTLLGATFLVVMIMELAPIDVVESLLPPTGEMNPAAREEREAYLNARYGLDASGPEKWARWVNNVSPIGLQTWKYDDPAVVEQRAELRAFRERIEPEVEAEVEAANPDLVAARDGQDTPSDERIQAIQTLRDSVKERLTELEDEQNFSPMSGEIRWDKLPIKTPDLGNSIRQSRPNWDIIKEALPITLILQLISIPTAVAISLITGIWSAKHRGAWQDWGTGGVLLALFSIPVIWVGVMAIGYFANDQYTNWFPTGGTTDLRSDSFPFFPRFGGEAGFQRGFLLDSIWHIALPVVCLTYAQFAYLSKLTRGSMLEVLGADYIRTARAKGLAPNTVLLRHGFRTALIPVITFLAALLPVIITGSIVIETIFGINGMGRLVIESLKNNDIELFLTVTLFTILLKLVAYLLADIAYVVADPRVSYSGGSSA